MSFTLATVADALIEFILSLLRDPELRAEFEEEPERVLAQHGLGNACAADVQAVAPVIIERTQVVQVPVIKQVAVPVEQHHAASSSSNPVVREINQVSQNFSWVDDRDTIVDQSVNQNIWAMGDVTQSFDNDAVVASGDDAIAAGDDVDIDETLDQSTTIEAGEDVNVGNDTEVVVVDDSYNEDADTTTDTDASTDIDIDDSGNDESTDVSITGSGDEQTDSSQSSDVQIDATTVAASDDVQVTEAEPEYTESAAQFTELAADETVDDSYESTATVLEETPTDDNF